MAHDEPDARQHPPQLLGLGLDRLDAIVDEEHLAAPIELAQDRVADEPGRRLSDPGLDRQAILRRRLDHAHVADAGERQVERARDRRGAQRQHVDLAPQLLQALLRRDAESLLLVHHDEPQVAELDVLAQEPVRPDDEVHRAVLQPRERRLLLGRRDKARQDPDAHRERSEPLPEGRVVLRGENRRRDEDRHLLAVLDRLERRPQGHLGLAIAHVADDQAVHGPAGLHVELDLCRGAELVRRLLVREARLHLGLPRGVVTVGVALGVRPRCVELQQLLRQVGYRLPDTLLRSSATRSRRAC